MSEQERARKVIQRAIEIMARGHYGWSWALNEARKEVSKERER